MSTVGACNSLVAINVHAFQSGVGHPLPPLLGDEHPHVRTGEQLAPSHRVDVDLIEVALVSG